METRTRGYCRRGWPDGSRGVWENTVKIGPRSTRNTCCDLSFPTLMSRGCHPGVESVVARGHKEAAHTPALSHRHKTPEPSLRCSHFTAGEMEAQSLMASLFFHSVELLLCPLLFSSGGVTASPSSHLHGEVRQLRSKPGKDSNHYQPVQ